MGCALIFGVARHVVCQTIFGLHCWRIVFGCWALCVLDSFCSGWGLMFVYVSVMIVFAVSCLGVLLCVCASIFVGHVAVVFVQPVTSMQIQVCNVGESVSVGAKFRFFIFDCVVSLFVWLFSLGQCLL